MNRPRSRWGHVWAGLRRDVDNLGRYGNWIEAVRPWIEGGAWVAPFIYQRLAREADGWDAFNRVGAHL